MKKTRTIRIAGRTITPVQEPAPLHQEIDNGLGELVSTRFRPDCPQCSNVMHPVGRTGNRFECTFVRCPESGHFVVHEHKLYRWRKPVKYECGNCGKPTGKSFREKDGVWYCRECWGLEENTTQARCSNTAGGHPCPDCGGYHIGPMP